MSAADPNCGLCGQGWPLPGVVLAMDTADGVQRCDSCDVYPGDLEAAQVAADLVGGVVRFEATDGHVYTFTGPTDLLIADGTNPWVEIDGVPVDWEDWTGRVEA